MIRAECGLYKLCRKIGTGAMASVYLAENELTHERVAIKVLEHEICSEFPNIEKRCERGARAISPIVHENIVRVYETGRYNNLRYVVMEYVDGSDLDSYLRGNGPLPWKKVAKIGLQLCRGLAAAHRHRLIHRDVKPANCLFEVERDLVKIADFGIARESRITLGEDITALDKLVGTPAYIAPEAVQASQPTPQMDIYSLGATLYKLLTDQLPFVAETPEELLETKRHYTPRRPSQILKASARPSPIEPIVMKALARYPDERYQSMEDMAEAFRLVLPAQVLENVPSPLNDDVETAAFRVPGPKRPAGERVEKDDGPQPTSEPRMSQEHESTREDHSVFERATHSPGFPWGRLCLHLLLMVVLLTFFGFSVGVLQESFDSPSELESSYGREPVNTGVPTSRLPTTKTPDVEVLKRVGRGRKTSNLPTLNQGPTVQTPLPKGPAQERPHEPAPHDTTTSGGESSKPQENAASVERKRKVRDVLGEFAIPIIANCSPYDRVRTRGVSVAVGSTVRVTVRVKPSGRAGRIRVTRTTNEGLKTCISDELKRRYFPEGAGTVSVSTKYSFRK